MTGKPDFSKHMVNLASSAFGSQGSEVSDDFFAEAKRMLRTPNPHLSRIFTMSMENGWMAGKAEGDANRGMIMRWSNLEQEGLFMVWTSTPVTSRVTTPQSIVGRDGLRFCYNPVSGDWEELLPVSELGSPTFFLH